MREKITNFEGGNSVCRGAKPFRGRCVRKSQITKKETAFAGVKKIVGWRCVRKSLIRRYLKEGNSVCRGTKILISHFASKQKGKALPFCFALISTACRQGKAHPVHKKHKFRHNALLPKPSPSKISFGIRGLHYFCFLLVGEFEEAAVAEDRRACGDPPR